MAGSEGARVAFAGLVVWLTTDEGANVVLSARLGAVVSLAPIEGARVALGGKVRVSFVPGEGKAVSLPAGLLGIAVPLVGSGGASV